MVVKCSHVTGRRRGRVGKRDREGGVANVLNSLSPLCSCMQNDVTY
jgi:hypothetical protein